MCLGVPGKVLSIDNYMSRVKVGAVEVSADLRLTPEARLGDYVLIHAGFALKVLRRREARQRLDALDRLNRFASVLQDQASGLAESAAKIGPVKIMEVCGTHTVAIARSGLKSRLPENIELISGPGCPVCVTPVEEVDMAVELAAVHGARVATFGDMLRVPGSSLTLEAARAAGASVDTVYSPLQALALAKRHDQEVVFLAVGFETTAPLIAAAIEQAAESNLDNFSIFAAHRLIPPALEALLRPGDLPIAGLICPGHVSTIIGASAYADLARRYQIPCVIAGFEPEDIFQAVAMIAAQVAAGEAKVENQYSRAVTYDGNVEARRRVDKIFDVVDGRWRGLGAIKASALAIKPAYADFDARKKFSLLPRRADLPGGCLCGEILSGRARALDCRLFGGVCRPEHPIGPCMVSTEGSCQAAYLFTGARSEGEGR